MRTKQHPTLIMNTQPVFGTRLRIVETQLNTGEIRELYGTITFVRDDEMVVALDDGEHRTRHWMLKGGL